MASMPMSVSPFGITLSVKNTKWPLRVEDAYFAAAICSMTRPWEPPRS